MNDSAPSRTFPKSHPRSRPHLGTKNRLDTRPKTGTPLQPPVESPRLMPEPPVTDLETSSCTAYLAADGFTEDLVAELKLQQADILAIRGRLVLARTTDALRPTAWAQNIWENPVFLHVSSIGDAARKLSEIQRNWHLYTTDHHRRATLIQEKLPHVSARPMHFGDVPPSSPLGSWTLWDANCILASSRCTSPFPDGAVRFHENRIDPPSRAYLKLWEVFTRLSLEPSLKLPGPGDLCLDLGSAPGGWTWVLANLGAQVFSIDKAPLAPQVDAMPGVAHCIGSGFALDPRHAGAVDWLFSDMICYPDKLLEVITRWLELGSCRNFVCTLKFQAETDHTTATRFAAIPGSRLLHLSCNKHELTWIKLEQWG